MSMLKGTSKVTTKMEDLCLPFDYRFDYHKVVKRALFAPKLHDFRCEI